MNHLDLVWLVADEDMKATAEELLKRHLALGIRAITAQVLVHPQRDPGCFRDASSLLKGYRHRARHALVMLDRAWDGAPQQCAATLELQLERALAQEFGDRWARAVVIDPELESWVFAGSPNVDQVLGWAGRNPPLLEALRQKGLLAANQTKPADPKRALEYALREARKPRSSSIYRQLARRVTLKGCQDRAFQRLKTLLREWFP